MVVKALYHYNLNSCKIQTEQHWDPCCSVWALQLLCRLLLGQVTVKATVTCDCVICTVVRQLATPTVWCVQNWLYVA